VTVGFLLLAGCGVMGGGSGGDGSSSSLSHNQGSNSTDPIQDPPADLVLGQIDFVSSLSNQGQSSVNQVGLNNPVAVAIDRSAVPNRIYVSDFNNNRVLGWADISSLTNGAPADLVLGQPDFSQSSCDNGGITADSLCAPMGIGVDGGGNLYVADRGNSRLMVYFSPFTTDTTADRVIGQPTFSTAGCSNPQPFVASSISLCDPFSVSVDGAGNVYVADMANNRILEYDSPLSTDIVADRVIGQPGFTTTAAGLGPSGLNQPYDVTVDASGNVYVADFRNNRVLEYDNPLGSCSTCDTLADHVFGQPNFMSNIVNAGKGPTAPSDKSLAFPIGVAVDLMGNLYVVDYANSRMLDFFSPLTTDAVADVVFGQPSFTSNGCNRKGLTAKSLCLPHSAAFDGDDNVWVVDFANNRVLRYGNPGAPPPPPPSNVTVLNASMHFEEENPTSCSLQTELEFSFEKTPGDITSGDEGHTTNDIVDSSVVVTMTFPDNVVATSLPGTGVKEDDRNSPEAPYFYGLEYKVNFDCATMEAHVGPYELVGISVSGTLTDGDTFSGTGKAKTHPP